MTHPPSLPNGFSRDFSEAPKGSLILAYGIDQTSLGLGGTREGVGFMRWHDGVGLTPSRWSWVDRAHSNLRPLCWCPIPTPGDAVLKELAEGK